MNNFVQISLKEYEELKEEVAELKKKNDELMKNAGEKCVMVKCVGLGLYDKCGVFWGKEADDIVKDSYREIKEELEKTKLKKDNMQFDYGYILSRRSEQIYELKEEIEELKKKIPWWIR